MADVAELEVRVADHIDPNVDRKLGGLDSSFAKLSLGVTAFAAGLQIARGAIDVFGRAVGTAQRFIADGITAANEQDDAISRLNQTLLSTGRFTQGYSTELQALASELQGVTKFGDETTLAAQALLLTFTQVGRDVLPEAVERIQDVATAMRTDLQTATIQVGKALNDPILGLTSLSRSGIQFTDSQKDLIKHFVSVNDLASAQRIILDELSTQFGGQARAAAETYSGRLGQLANAWGDVREEVGFFVTQSYTARDVISELTFEVTTLSGDLRDFRTDGEGAEEILRAITTAGFEFTGMAIGMAQALGTLTPLFKFFGLAGAGALAVFSPQQAHQLAGAIIDFDVSPALRALDELEVRVGNVRERVEARFDFRDSLAGFTDLDRAFEERVQRAAELRRQIEQANAALVQSLPDVGQSLATGREPDEINQFLRTTQQELARVDFEARATFDEFARRGIEAAESTQELAKSLGLLRAERTPGGTTGIEASVVREIAADARNELASFAEQIRRDVRTPFEELQDFRIRVGAAFDAGLISADQMNRALDITAEKLFHGSRVADELARALDADKAAALQFFESTRTPAERFEAQLIRIRDLSERGLIDGDTTSRAIKQAADDLEGFTQRAEGSFDRLIDATDGFGRGFSRTFAEGLADGELAFKSFTRSLLIDLNELLIHEGLTRPLLGFVQRSVFGTTDQSGNRTGGLFDFSTPPTKDKAPDAAEDAFDAVASSASSDFSKTAGQVGQDWSNVANQVGAAFIAAASGGGNIGATLLGIAGSILASAAGNAAGGAFGGSTPTTTSGPVDLQFTSQRFAEPAPVSISDRDIGPVSAPAPTQGRGDSITVNLTYDVRMLDTRGGEEFIAEHRKQINAQVQSGIERGQVGLGRATGRRA